MKAFIKSALMATMLCIVLALTASAQNGTGEQFKNMTPTQRAAFQTNLMKTKLNLDSAEVMKVKPINEKYAAKIQVLLKSDENRFARIRKAKSVQEQKDKELKAVFTAAQYKQYQDIEAELMKKASEFVSLN